MKRWVRIVGAIVALLVGLAAVPFVWVWTAPGHFLRTAQTWSIDGALGGPESVPAPSGAVRVWRVGEGDGPTIVLVHGFGDAAAGWTTVASTLSADHRVVLLDLPGHGRSEPHGPPLRFADLVGGLDAVMATVDGEVILVGNSLGGWVGTLWTLDHPDRVAELVLVNTAGFAQALDRDVLLPSTREGMRQKNVAVMGEHAPQMPGIMLDGLIAMHQDPRMQTFFDGYDRMDTLDGKLAGLPVPVRLIWGAPDPFFPVDSYLARVQAERPDAPRFVLEGCGHAPQYSCPHALVEALLADR